MTHPKQAAFVVNDNAIIRLTITTLLSELGVVAHTPHSEQTMLNDIQHSGIDLVVLDSEMTSMNAYRLLGRISRSNTPTRVLMTGNRYNAINIRHAKSLGAHAFICTNESIDIIRTTMKSIIAGYSLFPLMVDFCNDVDSIQNHPVTKQQDLSIREAQILKRITSGMKHTHIAHELSISVKTVSTYKHRIMNKLNLNTNFELLDYARINGIA